jgi:hypothetical protein
VHEINAKIKSLGKTLLLYENLNYFFLRSLKEHCHEKSVPEKHIGGCLGLKYEPCVAVAVFSRSMALPRPNFSPTRARGEPVGVGAGALSLGRLPKLYPLFRDSVPLSSLIFNYGDFMQNLWIVTVQYRLFDENESRYVTIFFFCGEGRQEIGFFFLFLSLSFV